MERKGPVYLAGKIAGDENYVEKFAKAQKELEGRGYIVLNPAETLKRSNLPYDACMRIARAMLLECPEVCFLPDWTRSEGALIEFGTAAAHQKKIMFYEDIVGGENEQNR